TRLEEGKQLSDRKQTHQPSSKNEAAFPKYREGFFSVLGTRYPVLLRDVARNPAIPSGLRLRLSCHP
ncbi:MAG: hypothetical protein WCC16_05470, partial [Candidatus Sulfotelmatobacter sp.]